jgi:hypothetical protein
MTMGNIQELEKQWLRQKLKKREKRASNLDRKPHL